MNEYFEKLLIEIEKSLVEGINPQRGVLQQAMHYSLSVKGKRLRPLLLLTLIESFGHNPLQYLDIASAIEIIHTYSLIHDDLPAMDNDDLRRGLPTVHKKFNEAIALLCGDTLLTLAFERISKASLSAEKRVNILRILTESIGANGMAGGQALDLGFSGDKEKIFEIHKKKTARLITGTLLSAGEIAGLAQGEMNLLQEAGLTIGVAFQLADDLLDIEGDEVEVGKRLQKDADNQSPNSVIFFGRERVMKMIDQYYSRTLKMLEDLNIEFAHFLSLIKKMVYRNK